MRTDYQGNVAAVDTSLPFGDNYVQGGPSFWATQDPLQFAGQDWDFETQTDHAMFRQYSPTQGRWMSPDPYDGSYNATNPQSFNRYTYVLNNPLTLVDPLGLNNVVSLGSDGCWYEWDTADSDGTLTLWYCGQIAGAGSGGGGDIGSSTGGGGVSGEGGSLASNLACAAKFGQAHSIGALFGGGTIANFLGGNSVSSLVNLGLSISGNQPSATQPYLTGIGQGLPVNDALRLTGGQTSPLYGSPAGSIRSAGIKAVFNAATESGGISSIAAESGELAVQGGLTAGEFASGVGIAKFGLDAITFGYGYFFGCAK